MINSQKLFIGVVFIGLIGACTPEHISENRQAEDSIGEPLEETNPIQNTTPDTGDDQSIEPDNDKDG
ncbi:hypothetical protein [Mesonia aquimarina]|uniref:hypothetical protein n=1 Tax=Mesonia aquimarina TaxID=1504967 RepID=UPI000EF571E1|nr:hypothetical protein [Mesonia aquimarina]